MHMTLTTSFSIEPAGVIAIVVFAIVGLICITLNRHMSKKSNESNESNESH